MSETKHDDRQYAIQTLVNAGSRYERWDFDSDFEITRDLDQARRDAAIAKEIGYRAEHVRIVVIQPLAEATR